MFSPDKLELQSLIETIRSIQLLIDKMPDGVKQDERIEKILKETYLNVLSLDINVDSQEIESQGKSSQEERISEFSRFEETLPDFLKQDQSLKQVLNKILKNIQSEPPESTTANTTVNQSEGVGSFEAWKELLFQCFGKRSKKKINITKNNTTKKNQ